jgi:hypothetical protein
VSDESLEQMPEKIEEAFDEVHGEFPSGDDE